MSTLLSAGNLRCNTKALKSKPDIYRDTEPLKILAIQVEFQKDDISATTGNGALNSGYENLPDSVIPAYDGLSFTV